uniref:Uncharacterized protein n=1 Tax=Arundo donax TaxID=35708 RepID=A0A0A9FDZ1_ARUDO
MHLQTQSTFISPSLSPIISVGSSMSSRAETRTTLDVISLHQLVVVGRSVELRGAVVASAHLHRRGVAVNRGVEADAVGVPKRHPPDVRPAAAFARGNVRHVQFLDAALVQADVRGSFAVGKALQRPPPVPCDIAQGFLCVEHDDDPGKGREIGLGVHLVLENHVT